MKEKLQPVSEKEISNPVFLELLDAREDQLRQSILGLQITLADVIDTRNKIETSLARDMRVKYFMTLNTLRIESSVKPNMGFKPRS